jgi:hypothetical protein
VRDLPPPDSRPVKRFSQFVSSLKLTVWLLALSILVVFFGTLAQTEDGLYVAQQKYFRSLYAVWSPHDPSLKWIKILLPGGYLLGTLLLVNLVAAHFTRFKPSWQKAGIFLTHIGVILLLLGQFATDMFARESRMSFAEGQWRNFSEDFHATELAFLADASSPDMDEVVAIPTGLLAAGEEVRHEKLPFTLRVKQWAENAEIRRRGPRVDKDRPAPATEGAGANLILDAVAATRAMDQRNTPAAVVEIVDAAGKSLGTWLFGLVLNEQEFEVGGKTYRGVLRSTRYYDHFSVKLLKTTHEVYRGTEIPRNFQSRVLLDNPETGEKREVDIYMNNPLRYAGLTFFQHQMGRDEVNVARGTSAFQVVKNPSWLTPYLGTIVVGIGLMVQFMIHLVGFVRKRAA